MLYTLVTLWSCNIHLYCVTVFVFVFAWVLVLVVFLFCISYVTNLALWLQYVNKLHVACAFVIMFIKVHTYLPTYLVNLKCHVTDDPVVLYRLNPDKDASKSLDALPVRFWTQHWSIHGAKRMIFFCRLTFRK